MLHAHPPGVLRGRAGASAHGAGDVGGRGGAGPARRDPVGWDVVVQADLRGVVWVSQVGRRVGRLSAATLADASDLVVSGRASAPSGVRVGPVLGGPADRRWAFKAGEGRALDRLARACTAASGRPSRRGRGGPPRRSGSGRPGGVGRGRGRPQAGVGGPPRPVGCGPWVVSVPVRRYLPPSPPARPSVRGWRRGGAPRRPAAAVARRGPRLVGAQDRVEEQGRGPHASRFAIRRSTGPSPPAALAVRRRGRRSPRGVVRPPRPWPARGATGPSSRTSRRRGNAPGGPSRASSRSSRGLPCAPARPVRPGVPPRRARGRRRRPPGGSRRPRTPACRRGGRGGSAGRCCSSTSASARSRSSSSVMRRRARAASAVPSAWCRARMPSAISAARRRDASDMASLSSSNGRVPIVACPVRRPCGTPSMLGAGRPASVRGRRSRARSAGGRPRRVRTGADPRAGGRAGRGSGCSRSRGLLGSCVAGSRVDERREDRAAQRLRGGTSYPLGRRIPAAAATCASVTAVTAVTAGPSCGVGPHRPASEAPPSSRYYLAAHSSAVGGRRDAVRRAGLPARRHLPPAPAPPRAGTRPGSAVGCGPHARPRGSPGTRSRPRPAPSRPGCRAGSSVPSRARRPGGTGSRRRSGRCGSDRVRWAAMLAIVGRGRW